MVTASDRNALTLNDGIVVEAEVDEELDYDFTDEEAAQLASNDQDDPSSEGSMDFEGDEDKVPDSLRG